MVRVGRVELRLDGASMITHEARKGRIEHPQKKREN